MRRIFGWMGRLDCVEPPDALLAMMNAAWPGGETGTFLSRAERDAALHVDADEHRHGREMSDANGEISGPLWAAIEGRPRWVPEKLAALAHRQGDAAALKDAYRKSGPALLQGLSGPFSLAVLDRSSRRLLLAIDRFGRNAMYYSILPGKGVVFGSTADLVRMNRAVITTVSTQGVFSYLYFGFCPSPETIYPDLRKLEPAQYLLCQDGVVTTDFYWRMPYSEGGGTGIDALAEELHGLLRQAIGRAIKGHESGALGAFLSGGLDSSTVVGLLAERTPGGVKAFTIGFQNERFDEMRYARIVAEHFMAKHSKYYLTPKDVSDTIVKVTDYCDEPFGNSSIFPAYVCARLAAEAGVTLMVAGDGGDEIFAGNNRYVEQQRYEQYSRLPVSLRRYAIEPLVFGLPDSLSPRFMRLIRSYIQRAKIPLPDRLESRNLFETVPIADVVHPDALGEIDAMAPMRNLRKIYFGTRSSSGLQRMLNLDLKITLADNDLRKMGRACEMARLPVVYPFLDEDLVEFSGRVPPELLIRWLRRRYFYKHAMRAFLPGAVIAKRKHGFGMPYSDWLRGAPQLRELAFDCTSSFKRRHYLKPAFLDWAIDEKGGELGDDRTGLVWDVMMLELWLRQRESIAPF